MQSFSDALIAGVKITKDLRQKLYGIVAGGKGSTGPEKYQRKTIEEGTGLPCKKCSMRINLRKHTLEKIAHPNKYDNGFDYTEDFDGVQVSGQNTIYQNLKCVVGKGGSQTRTLREVYAFVEGQLKFLLHEPIKKVLFANIMDGDEAAAVMPKFAYLLNLPEYANAKSRVYVGDLKGYFAWFNAVNGV
jgi:hypothetical protein